MRCGSRSNPKESKNQVVQHKSLPAKPAVVFASVFAGFRIDFDCLRVAFVAQRTEVCNARTPNRRHAGVFRRFHCKVLEKVAE